MTSFMTVHFTSVRRSTGRWCIRYHISMLIGNRRTTRPIRAFRSPGDAVSIPQGAILREVRTSSEPRYRFPVAMKIVALHNPSLHVFEYRGETLYVHFVYGLMKATEEVTHPLP